MGRLLCKGLADALGAVLGARPIGRHARAPGCGLGIEIVETGEGAGSEEIVAHIADGALDPAFLVPARNRHRPRLVAIVSRECEQDRVEADGEANYSKYCPEMIVVPLGKFLMGSPTDDKAARDNERPQHEVSIAERFAISRFEVTFDQWDQCVGFGACNLPGAGSSPWGRGRQPVVYIGWGDGP